MKKNFKRKLLCTVLTAAMIIPVLSGCKGDSKAVSSVKMDKEHVYKAEYFDMPEGVDNFNQMKVSKDKVYVSGYDVKNNYQFQIYELSTDGGKTRSVLPKMPEAADGSSKSINSFTVDTEGNVYYLENEYTFDDSDPDNPISKSVLSLVKTDPEGKEVFREKIEQESDNFYVSDMIADKEGNIVLLSYEKLLLVDNTGKKIGEIDTTDVDSIFLSDDGKLLTTAYNYGGGTGKREVKELLVKEKKFGEPVDLPEGTTNASFFAGAGYDFYINDRTNVYGYDMESGKKTQLLNWIDSDMNGSMINNAGALSDGRILCIITDYMKNKSEMAIMTKVDPKDVVEKKILTLACVWADTNVSSAVIEFNKKNENYRITIKDYSIYNTDEENGYNAGSTKLNTDIISGDVPNILSVNDTSSFESSVSKGLFADLNTYMEKDKDFNKEDYLTNILDTFSKDGKLYTLVPYFDAITFIGKTKNVGSEPGWTLEELEKTVASMPEGTKIFDDQMSRTTIMYYGNNMCMDQFIDWKAGKCSFDNGEFEKLLEFANQFPSDEDIQNGRSNASMTEASVSIGGEMEEDELKFRKDKVLLNTCYLYNFRQIHEEQKVNFGDDITFIGFPTANKNGSAISPGLRLAVSAKADEDAQNASWEFLKMFMEDGFQDELESYWPTKLSSIEKKKEKEQKPDTYTDEKGKEVEYENTYTINGKEEKIGQVTDEECEKVMTFLKSLNQVMRYDQKVSEIIDEETGAYFAGQKSAKEVTGIIQNRVQTYLNEIQ